VQQHLGVAVIGRERVAPRDELAAQLAVVVDAAVEDDGQQPLGVAAAARRDHGLGAALRIDDRQATADQRDLDVAAPVGAPHLDTVAEPPGAVRPPVGDPLVNDIEPRLGDGLAVGAQDGPNAAHGRSSRIGGSGSSS
jgi:hypothetical protein